jgi:hypothetical protein
MTGFVTQFRWRIAGFLGGFAATVLLPVLGLVAVLGSTVWIMHKALQHHFRPLQDLSRHRWSRPMPLSQEEAPLFSSEAERVFVAVIGGFCAAVLATTFFRAVAGGATQ